MRLCLVLFALGFPAQLRSQDPDRLAAVRAALQATKKDVGKLRLPVYVATEKLPSDSADQPRESWTGTEVEAFTQSFLPVSRRAEDDLLSCGGGAGCTHRVAAVVFRIAEPVLVSAGKARVRLIWTWPVGGGLDRTKGTSLLAHLEARDGAWVVTEAEYSDP